MDDLVSMLRAELGAARIRSEAELQAWIERLLVSHQIAHQREASLPGVGRPDFLVGRFAVEVKVGGSRMELIRQVQRYATSPAVDGVLVVTTRLSHRLPATLAGKRVTVVYLTVFGVV